MRVNVSHKFWEKFRSILTNPDLIKNFLGEDFGIKITPKNLVNIKRYEDLIFTINLPRSEFRKNDNYSKFHKFIADSVNSGLLSRQEAVSMIPPLLMQIKPTDGILDTCAAPGSKTAQFFEVIYKDYDFLNPESYKHDTGKLIINIRFCYR